MVGRGDLSPAAGPQGPQDDIEEDGTSGVPEPAVKELRGGELPLGLCSGVSACPVLIIHVFGAYDGCAVYNGGHDSWYQFGFLIGAGSPFLGLFGRGRKWRER
jgi:hypothetical protein